MSKKLAIYFSNPEPMGYPFDSTIYPYWEVYQGLIRQVEAHNIEVYIVRGDSYIGKGVFSHGWRVDNGALVLVDKPITVDLIFNRDDKNIIPEIYDCPIINHPDLDRICVDKIKTAELFPEFSPKTKAISSYQELVETISQWNLNSEEKIVIKQNFLSGGQGIFILPVKEISESLYESWSSILVQEFIDNSIGIPGIIEGLHDFRVTSINGEPSFVLVRVPKAGSYLANVSQGGTEIPFGIDKIPKNLLPLVTAINDKLVQYRPSIFTSDFINSKNGFKLLELNSRPAVCIPSSSPDAKKYMDAMVAMLVNALS